MYHLEDEEHNQYRCRNMAVNDYCYCDFHLEKIKKR